MCGFFEWDMALPLYRAYRYGVEQVYNSISTRKTKQEWEDAASFHAISVRVNLLQGYGKVLNLRSLFGIIEQAQEFLQIGFADRDFAFSDFYSVVSDGAYFLQMNNVGAMYS